MTINSNLNKIPVTWLDLILDKLYQLYNTNMYTVGQTANNLAMTWSLSKC